MRKKPQAYQEWLRVIINKMPHLSKPQAVGLAMWSFGIAMTHSCGLTTVSVFIAQLLGRPENNLREQLRQWYRESSDKYGRKRQQIEVGQSFKPLLPWVLSWWSPEEKSLMLAADASTLGERFTVLTVSVVYRGCGIPVAWKLVAANEKGAWKPHWLDLFKHLKGGVPDDWQVIVTTDRGLYAHWLYQGIVQLGWHPLMRIKQRGFYQLSPQQPFLPLSQLVAQGARPWSGRVTCFKTNSLDCTLLASWEEGYADPWLLVTDLTPQQACFYWYGLRSWIECLFKDLKRGGFGWHHTKMTDPARAERLWLALAVATLWLVSVGGAADPHLSASSFPPESDLPSSNSVDALATPLGTATTLQKTTRSLSCFRRGFLCLLASLLNHLPLPLGHFVPEFSVSSG